MDIIIHDYYGYEGIEFIFATKESVEPLKQAQIDQIYINMRVLSPSEIRSRLGYDPLTCKCYSISEPFKAQTLTKK